MGEIVPRNGACTGEAGAPDASLATSAIAVQTTAPHTQRITTFASKAGTLRMRPGWRQPAGSARGHWSDHGSVNVPSPQASR